MTDKLSDNWQTPQDLFDELHEEFHFHIDACATDKNSKCSAYYIDYLKNSYVSPCGVISNVSPEDFTSHFTLFMNPPYSNPRPFIEKAWEDSKYCKIVCLVKCDPSTKWWATFWDYDTCGAVCDHLNRGNKPKPGCEVRFFPKRIKFDPPKGWEGKASSPSFSSALIIMDRGKLNND